MPERRSEDDPAGNRIGRDRNVVILAERRGLPSLAAGQCHDDAASLRQHRPAAARWVLGGDFG
jgi:hypothetical protein